ncbi:MAG: flippase activity-associated protein Agl23 [Chthoniobacterales bacterium]
MNPQPPVTKMRIDALPSSGAEPARGEIDAPPLAARLAGVDWTLWGIIAFGALLRFLFLSMKPPHFDEGINGWFVDQMMKNGFYRYDPTNYHGPLHFYILLVAQAIFDRHIWALRLPVVLASIGSIFLTTKFEPFVGRRVSRVAALAMAISPAFIFYGRYSIHEVWLLLFSMLFVLGLVGLWRLGTRGYLWCVGMGAAGMILTKETYIIHIGSAFIAGAVLWLSHKITPGEVVKRARQQWDLADLAIVVGTAIFFIVFFYSGTFLNWPGVKGLYLTFATWYQTGSNGNGHEKPWPYWLELTLRYEWPVLIGLLLCGVCQFFKNYVIRYLAIYGVGVFAAYSIIHYKTPWIIISIVWPLLFVFAAGATAPKIPRRAFFIVALAVFGFVLGAFLSYTFQPEAVRATNLGTYLRETVVVTLAATSTSAVCGEIGQRLFASALVFSLLGGGLGYLIGETRTFSDRSIRAIQKGVASVALAMSLGMAIWLNFFRYSVDAEPYVYVQTYDDIYKLMKPVMRLVRSNPLNYRMVGHFIRTSTYPFPWLLGEFPNVGYYEHNNSPGKYDGDFLVVQEDRVAEVEKNLHETYFTQPMTIRPYQDASKLYLNARTFRKLFPNQRPDFVGHPIAAPAR